MGQKELIYFAYGSNMASEQMALRTGRIIQPMGIAKLEGYIFGYWGHSELWDLKGTADLTKSEDSTSTVLGLAYSVSPTEAEELDIWEQVSMGRYKRINIAISLNDKNLPAFTYVLKRDGGWHYPEDKNDPSPEYVQQCRDAAIQAKLPKEYIDKYLVGPFKR